MRVWLRGCVRVRVRLRVVVATDEVRLYLRPYEQHVSFSVHWSVRRWALLATRLPTATHMATNR